MDQDDPHTKGVAVVATAGEALQAPCQELNLDEGRGARPKPWTTSLPSGQLQPRGRSYTLVGVFVVCCLLQKHHSHSWKGYHGRKLRFPYQNTTFS
ncbi:hypothetical protein CapIbe_001452 [Capra ibex]